MTNNQSQLSNRRKIPNILITGVPGTGKSTLSELLAAATSLTHINVGDLVKQHSLHDGWEDEFQCYIVNEDKICDHLEDIAMRGGNILDFHTVDFFPESWIDKVCVLRTDNTTLYDRLVQRGYPEHKINENVTAEIMEVVVCDAYDSYNEEVITLLSSNTIDEMESNVDMLKSWVEKWVQIQKNQ